MNTRILFLFSVPLVVLFLCAFSFKEKRAFQKPRVIVLTDISSLTAGYKEPDDGQSLIRLMLYTNELDIEGLIATSNLQHGQTVKPELIQQVVEAYGNVSNNLRLHDSRYPTKEYLLSKIKRGNPIADKNIPIVENIGKQKDTEASEWIIKVIDKPDARPVWITIWGGGTDLAQALWKIKSTRTNEALKKFVSKIRVRAIGDQDGAGPWLRQNFPALYYILQKVSLRGMYRGGDTTLVSETWVQVNLKNHGPLGNLYPIYNGGDIWSSKLGGVKGVKEGDTPSFLALLHNGLNDEYNARWLSWGGRFIRDSLDNYFTDAVDSLGNFATDPNPALATVYRWREAFQNDFASRIDWCEKTYGNANHAPLPAVKLIKTGRNWVLNASGSKDPDGSKLSFSWFTDKAASTFKVDRLEENAQGEMFSIQAPASQVKQTLHVILQVKDDGTPELTRYKRIILQL